jgi:hypothetical protein
MTPNTFTFVSKKLENSDYESKKFDKLKAIVSEAGKNARSHKTKPGKHSPDVSVYTKGETAFQRALYNHSVGFIQLGKLLWCDIELPVAFSQKSRRRCVDLVGHLENHGHFLCELKYAKSEKSASSKDPDYAVLEALLYYGLVEKNQKELDNYKVWRDERNAQFYWADVAKSRTIMVLANDSFWGKAQRNPAASERICELVNSIQSELKIGVLLCKTPDFDFKKGAANDPKRYCPQMPNGADKWETVRFEVAC